MLVQHEFCAPWPHAYRRHWLTSTSIMTMTPHLVFVSGLCTVLGVHPLQGITSDTLLSHVVHLKMADRVRYQKQLSSMLQMVAMNRRPVTAQQVGTAGARTMRRLRAALQSEFACKVCWVRCSWLPSRSGSHMQMQWGKAPQRYLIVRKLKSHPVVAQERLCMVCRRPITRPCAFKG